MPSGQYTRKSTSERLFSMIEVQPNGCWHFTGSLNNRGYGRISIGAGIVKLAHRVSYELKYGPIPDGIGLDHRCHKIEECEGGINCLHRRCVNPDHVCPTTDKDNYGIERSHGLPRAWAASAAVRRAINQCLRGHQYTPDNTYLSPKGKRSCRQCNRMFNRIPRHPVTN